MTPDAIPGWFAVCASLTLFVTYGVLVYRTHR